MRRIAWVLALVSLPVVPTAISSPPQAPGITPAASVTAAFDADRLARIDDLVNAAIVQHRLPGAVVLVGRHGGVGYRRAFGHRGLVPVVESMTLDTMFDLASLTKVVATTTSVMMLMEEGRIRLTDPVARYIPEFAKYGKQGITIRHLLTHMSGLRPDLDLSAEFDGYDTAVARSCEEVPEAPPGERFEYSDINFLLLGDIVARVSGKPLNQFVTDKIFRPLGMHDTTFLPPSAAIPRIAPTEPCTPLGWPCESPGESMLRGVVHDPTARRMGGVAGHAGLFSTADDLAIFCRMLLGRGIVGTTRILSPLTVAKMTSVATPPGIRNARGLGWDLDSTYSANRGDLLPIGSFGHTGFTGTSLWIDPLTDMFVVFLSNRVHPDGKGDVSALRGQVATVAASALTNVPPMAALRAARWTGEDFGASAVPREPAPAPLMTGIDVLRSDAFAPIRGKRVGLLTNQVGRDRRGESTVDLLRGAPGVTLVSLFSPEHGLAANVDDDVPSSRDERTGLTIHSLYGESRRPTAAMLDGLDALVVDLQDVGSRFYTFGSTLGYVMEACASRRIQVVVLDRPNPVNGFAVEGPIQDADQEGFNTYFPMPIRHGLTLGELAKLFNAEKKIGADLLVVPMKNWRRGEWFDETGVTWRNPSPNMRNLLQATLYPGIGAFEGTNVSVGRGTDTPFEQIGAPWIDGARLAEALNARDIPGVRFYPVSFTPAAGSRFGGETCEGVFLVIMDRAALRPVRLGVEIAAALVRLHGSQFELEKALNLFGSKSGLARIRNGDDPVAIASSWAGDEARWRLLRAGYLIY